MLKVINPQVVKFEYKHNDKVQKLGANAALLFQHICYWMQTQSVNVVFRTNQQLSEDLEGALSVSQVARAKAKLIQAGLIAISQDLKKRLIHTTHYRLTKVGEKVVASLKGIKQKVVDKAKQSSVSKKQATKQAVKVATVDETPKVELSETAMLLIEEQAQLEGKSTQEVADQYLQPVETVVTTKAAKASKVATHTTKKQWIPKEEYKAMKQAEFKQQQNKEMCVSKAMQESFKQGFGNPNATKGIPAELLKKLPSFLKNRIK